MVITQQRTHRLLILPQPAEGQPVATTPLWTGANHEVEQRGQKDKRGQAARLLFWQRSLTSFGIGPCFVGPSTVAASF